MSKAQGRNKRKHNGVAHGRGRLNGHGQSRALAVHNGHGPAERPVVITGGAGFIGTNLAHRLLSAGRRVILYDNLSRPGVEQNLAWLQATHGARVRHEPGDVRDFARLRQVVKEAGQVFHLAAQVAVTTSLEAPFEDFEINARGTLNLLEALRSLPQPPPLVFTSTNKVYGDLKDVKLRCREGRYEPEEERIRRHGFSEECSLHFHSPYGCSKGAACQYVQDYARTFGLPTVVFRMSCIYGPHQFGTEDQGWVAHFLIQALEQSPITIYGDGRQVRDILFVEDLVDAFLLAQEHMPKIRGEVFNIGGGPTHTTSLLELMDAIRELHGQCAPAEFADWRPADQQYYVSDTRKFSTATGWVPRVDVKAGLKRLYHWLQEFHRVASARPANGLKPSNGHGLRPSVPLLGTASVLRNRAPKLKKWPANGRTSARRTGRVLARSV